MDDDIKIDLSHFKKLFSGTFIKTYLWIFLILIPIFLSVYIRTTPLKMEIAEDWARQGIYNNIRANIDAQVKAQYPNLPEQNRAPLVEQQLSAVLASEKAQIEQAVIQQAEALRAEFRDGKGDTYLGDIDSYYWLRYAENIEKTGKIGDEYVNGETIDTHMNAPNGYSFDPNMYPYIEAYVHKFLKLFNKNISVMMSAFYTPMFMSFVAIILAFLIGKKLSGNLAGLIASVLVSVNPMILSRTLGSDNDMVNFIFPLAIMLFVIYAFDAKNYKQIIIYTIITGLLTGLYQFAWSGWWFMFLFIIAAGFAYAGFILFNEFYHKKDITKLMQSERLRHIMLFLGLFFISTFIGLSIVGEGHELFKTFQNPFKIINLKSAAKGTSIWPNVYTTVAELNAASISQVTGSLGGKIFLILALIGTLVSLINLKTPKTTQIGLLYLAISGIYFMFFLDVMSRFSSMIAYGLLALPLLVGILLAIYYNYKIEPIHSIIMAIWFIATIYASTKGIRFILLIVPAFAVSIAVFFGFLVNMISKVISDSLDMNQMIPKAIFAFLALGILIQPINQGYATAYQYVPSVNDGWVESLEYIKINSTEDAIINSWWDFGHWFKYWADRRVTFDGASQNSQNAHWIGKVLLTSDEEEATAILRMLDCGGQQAERELRKLMDNDSYKTVKMLYKLFKLSEKDAKAELLKFTTEDKANEIFSYLFCSPPENYFITSEDMVGKSGVWAHFGIWNFERASIYNLYNIETYDKFISNMSKDYGYDSETSKRLYFEIKALGSERAVNDWIAPWPSYGGGVNCITIDSERKQCNVPIQNNQVIPLVINFTDMNAYVDANGDRFYPNNFAYFEGNDFRIKEYEENRLGYGIVYIDNSVLFMSPELTGSMFTRLFYLDGKGIKRFEKVYGTTDVTGARIKTWKLKWEI